MGDEAVKIFLNAKGTLDDVSDELKAFLDYVAGKKPKDAYVERLEEAVKKPRRIENGGMSICVVNERPGECENWRKTRRGKNAFVNGKIDRR